MYNELERVVSFDIFDTLLLRPYTDPQDLWRTLEEQENAVGFSAARKLADAQTYGEASERGGETTIEEAYAIMPKQFQGLMLKEMELERKVLRANPEMLREWNRLGSEGKKRILISDMYLPKEFIESALRKNGFEGWDKFYLSRDYNCRKTTGELFKVALNDLGIDASEMLHIGDNGYSDVKVPSSLGIQVRPYTKVKDQFFVACPFARDINGHLAGTLALGWQSFKLDRPEHTYWNRLGFVVGGILSYMYVNWIVNTAKDLGITRLLFVARDGYVLKKICNELYPNIETEYIYAPRLTSIAVLGAIGSDPGAIADRQRYIDEHLKGVNTAQIENEYKSYIDGYIIDEHTAIVDGCSSGFSAQNLIEKSIGRPVFSFYLLAMAEMHNAAALFSSWPGNMRFQMLSEFILGAPELPIVGVHNGRPQYNNECSPEEQFKISVSNEIAVGALCASKVLFEENIDIKPDVWVSFADKFVSNLTEEDRQYLSLAKNAADVQQKRFNSLVWTPRPQSGIHIYKTGRFSFELKIYKGYSETAFYLSRKGLYKRTADHSYKTNVIDIVREEIKDGTSRLR